MTVEAITDAIHEFMYEKWNDSQGTKKEKNIRYLRKTDKTNERTTRQTDKIQKN